jgi:putative flippase GtrA
MSTIFNNPLERRRFFKFLVVGSIGFIIDFGIYNFLFKVIGLPYIVSADISLFCAIISNFFFNRYWTYPDSRSKPIVRQFFQFTIVNLIGGLPIRTAILNYVEPIITKGYHLIREDYLFFTANSLGEDTTFVIAVFIVLLWNFFVNRYWTYSDVKS